MKTKSSNPSNPAGRFLTPMYAVRDMRIGQYHKPLVFSCDDEAVRAFGDAITHGGESLIALHPEDFAIFRIGTYDAESGLLVPCDLSLVASGDQFKKDVKN